MTDARRDAKKILAWLKRGGRAKVRAAVDKAIAATRARQRRRDELWHDFLKTINQPLT